MVPPPGRSLGMRQARRSASALAPHVAVWLILLFAIFPFYWAVNSTLKPSTELYTLTPSFLPHTWTGDNYLWAINQDTFVSTIRNSLIVGVITAIVSVILTCMMGYSLARMRYPGKNVIVTGLVATQMLPGVMLVVPIFVVFVTLQRLIHIDLVNTFQGLVLGFATFSLPFSALLLRGFFTNFPGELEDAAMVDGCTRFRAFLLIVLPLSIPGILTAALFAFVLAWSDLLFAMVLTNNTRAQTVAVTITQLATAQYSNTNYGGILAEGVLITLPVVVLFVFLQRFLIEGMTAGAIKG
jgi:multiple sugar transport system permease protein